MLTTVNNYLSKKNKPLKIQDISSYNHIVKNPTKNLPPSKELKGYGIRLIDSNGKIINNLIYRNSKSNYYISFINANNYSDSVGFMILIDGKIQPFFIDNNSKSEIIHNEPFKPYSLVNIPISFNPIVKDTNIAHKMYILAIYNQNILPNQKNPYIDSYTAPYICKFNFSKKNNTNSNNLTENNLIDFDKLTIDNSKSSDFWTGISYGNTINQFHQNNNFLLDSQKNNTLYTFGAVLPKGLYTTIIFLDNIPIKFENNNSYITWQSMNNNLMFYKFNISKNLNKGIHQLYSITLPLQINDTNFFESGKIKITVQ